MPSPAIVSEALKLRHGVPYAGTITIAPAGSPMNLTGLKASASLHRGTPEDPDAVVWPITTDNGRLVVSAPMTGVIAFALTGAVITTFTEGDYIMCLFVTDGSGNVVANGHPLIRYVQVLPSGVSP